MHQLVRSNALSVVFKPDPAVSAIVFQQGNPDILPFRISYGIFCQVAENGSQQGKIPLHRYFFRKINVQGQLFLFRQDVQFAGNLLQDVVENDSFTGDVLSPSSIRVMSETSFSIRRSRSLLM